MTYPGYLKFEGEISRIEYDKAGTITAIVATTHYGTRARIEIGKPEIPMGPIIFDPDLLPIWLPSEFSQRPPLTITYDFD